MKRVLTIIFSVACISCYAQDWSAIDREVQFIDAKDPATLSVKLTQNYHTDIEKVRSIFRWITEHISYNRPSPRASRWKDQTLGFQPAEDTGAITPLSERVALKVLMDRRTHCEGYARLFQSLCAHAGITAAIITGYARAGNSSRFRSNHSWNAVWIDSSWKLLDVTWAAGHFTYNSTDFIQNYTEYYFLTPPESFARHHYPDDLRWTLLANPPAIDEIRKTPFRARSYNKYDITDFFPSKGIIEASVGDTIRLEIRTNFAKYNRSVAPDTLWDSSSMILDKSWAYISPAENSTKDKIVYLFPVESSRIEWIHLMYNNDAVLRYRLNIQPRLQLDVSSR